MNTIIRKTTKFGLPQMNTMDIRKIGLDAWYDQRKIVFTQNANIIDVYGRSEFVELTAEEQTAVRKHLNHIHTEPYGLSGGTHLQRPIAERLENNMRTRAEAHNIKYELGCSRREFMQWCSKQFRIGMCRGIMV